MKTRSEGSRDIVTLESKIIGLHCAIRELSILRWSNIFFVSDRKSVREPASFWREYAIAVVILLHVLATVVVRKKVIQCYKSYDCAIGRGLNLQLFRWKK